VWGPGLDEEFAVAGILWDVHDSGTERGGIFFADNRIFTRASAVMNNTDDTYATDVKSVISIIDRKEPKTLEALLISLNGGSLGPTSASLDIIKIGLNHGAFADISGTRNWFHDSWNAEPVGQTGNAPDRLIRSSPVPEVPGSNLVSDRDARFNVTIKHIEGVSHYDFSYLVDMKAGEPTFFSVPPEYYPSTVIVTPLSQDGDHVSGTIEINSTDYWNYIRASPAEDQVFRSITVGGSAVDAIQYIHNAKSLLSRASSEYSSGNSTGAELLVNIAYQDNFERVGTVLDQLNATGLKAEIEEMTQVELVELIESRADPATVDAKVAEINAKLDEAIVIVPEFPLAVLAILAAGNGLLSILSRIGRYWLHRGS
jgi:hypothetical protein